jgi:hypothetical protein
MEIDSSKVVHSPGDLVRPTSIIKFSQCRPKPIGKAAKVAYLPQHGNFGTAGFT